MKKPVFLSILITCTIMVLVSCSKDDGGEPATGMILVKTIPGGCNNMNFDGLKSALPEDRDTVIFSMRKDTLVMFTGINYICCAPFETETAFRNDSLVVSLTDTCNYPNENCYCKCMCYYTWEFLFTGFEVNKEQGFKVILDDPRQKEPVIIMEGPVKL